MKDINLYNNNSLINFNKTFNYIKYFLIMKK